ncbi:hypothetical protein [Umezawaea tangerina]|uniref:Uncharacterized protein n=1 Tax=Umezawaea tangerina TaxID=84725 RepID=A0A2T0TK56_9PSEU|nr:hypothetical protein [Umezawaea tangerina]PRY46005.1 hypothetical protein CLV43_101269 [Umezawaea tangerina]
MSATVKRNHTTWRLLVGTRPAGTRVLVSRTGRAVTTVPTDRSRRITPATTLVPTSRTEQVAPTTTDVPDNRTRQSATGHEVVGAFDARVPAHQDTEAVAPRAFRLLGIRPSSGGAA